MTDPKPAAKSSGGFSLPPLLIGILIAVVVIAALGVSSPSGDGTTTLPAAQPAQGGLTSKRVELFAVPVIDGAQLDLTRVCFYPSIDSASAGLAAGASAEKCDGGQLYDVAKMGQPTSAYSTDKAGIAKLVWEKGFLVPSSASAPQNAAGAQPASEASAAASAQNGPSDSATPAAPDSGFKFPDLSGAKGKLDQFLERFPVVLLAIYVGLWFLLDPLRKIAIVQSLTFSTVEQAAHVPDAFNMETTWVTGLLLWKPATVGDAGAEWLALAPDGTDADRKAKAEEVIRPLLDSAVRNLVSATPTPELRGLKGTHLELDEVDKSADGSPTVGESALPKYVIPIKIKVTEVNTSTAQNRLLAMVREGEYEGMAEGLAIKKLAAELNIPTLDAAKLLPKLRMARNIAEGNVQRTIDVHNAAEEG